MSYQITTKTNKLNQTIIIITFPHFTEIVDANGHGLDTNRIAARVSKKVAREIQAKVISIFNATLTAQEKQEKILSGRWMIVSTFADNSLQWERITRQAHPRSLTSEGAYIGGYFVPGRDKNAFFWSQTSRKNGTFRKTESPTNIGLDRMEGLHIWKKYPNGGESPHQPPPPQNQKLRIKTMNQRYTVYEKIIECDNWRNCSECCGPSEEDIDLSTLEDKIDGSPSYRRRVRKLKVGQKSRATKQERRDMRWDPKSGHVLIWTKRII